MTLKIFEVTTKKYQLSTFYWLLLLCFYFNSQRIGLLRVHQAHRDYTGLRNLHVQYTCTYTIYMRN